MRCCLTLLMSLVALHSSLALNHLEKPRWKTFREAELESAEYLFITNETLERYRNSAYPDEPSVRKLIGAIMIVLNAVNVKLNVINDYVLSQYFLPNTVDCQYKQHTKECLERNVATLDTSDRLGRAYQTFQCYYKNSGGIKEDVSFVPYHYSEEVQMLEDCFYITNTSNESLLKYCQGGYATNADYLKVAYCYALRAKLLDKKTGYNVEKMYFQIGNDNLIDGDAKKCVAKTVNQYCQEPYRTTRIVVDCVLKYLSGVPANAIAASNILGNPPECVIPPRPLPNTQPCYNGPCL